jgi:membrane protease YdiL (CAAX protease family)
MTRIIVCSLILSAFVFGLGHFMTGLSKAMDLGPFLVLCAVGCALILILAFAWDWYERSRAPRSQLSTPPDRRQLEP